MSESDKAMSGDNRRTSSRKGRGKKSGEGKNDDVFGPEFKEETLECEGEGCQVWQVVKVPKEWDAEKEGSFFCGICAGREINKLRKENKDLRENLGKNQTEMEVGLSTFGEKMRKTIVELEEAKEETVRMTNEKLATYAEKVKSSLEKVEKESGALKKEDLRKEVRKEVRENVAEERRKRRAIAFGLKVEDNKLESEVLEMLSKLKVRAKPVRVERMRKRSEEDETCKPVIIEFETEKENGRQWKGKGIRGWKGDG